MGKRRDQKNENAEEYRRHIIEWELFFLVKYIFSEGKSHNSYISLLFEGASLFILSLENKLCSVAKASEKQNSPKYEEEINVMNSRNSPSSFSVLSLSLCLSLSVFHCCIIFNSFDKPRIKASFYHVLLKCDWVLVTWNWAGNEQKWCVRPVKEGIYFSSSLLMEMETHVMIRAVKAILDHRKLHVEVNRVKDRCNYSI